MPQQQIMLDMNEHLLQVWSSEIDLKPMVSIQKQSVQWKLTASNVYLSQTDQKTKFCFAVITCPIVVAPANGFLSKENSIPMFGTRVDLACEEGFFLIGSPTLQCIDRDGDGRGEWDQPLPRCQGDM